MGRLLSYVFLGGIERMEGAFAWFRYKRGRGLDIERPGGMKIYAQGKDDMSEGNLGHGMCRVLEQLTGPLPSPGIELVELTWT